MKTVDLHDPRPLYVQLADNIREAITSGEFEPRAFLPTEVAMMREQNLSRGTVRAGLKVLAEQGWIVTIPQRGSYVAEKQPKA